jgi:hypothetical protein
MILGPSWHKKFLIKTRKPASLLFCEMRGVQSNYSCNIGGLFGYILKKYMGVKVKKRGFANQNQMRRSKATDFLKW